MSLFPAHRGLRAEASRYAQITPVYLAHSRSHRIVEPGPFSNAALKQFFWFDETDLSVNGSSALGHCRLSAPSNLPGHGQLHELKRPKPSFASVADMSHQSVTVKENVPTAMKRQKIWSN
ncbi:hypothetical protein HBI38_004860 [Parastagonospora nodorum]|nr:hypothetical protein HBI95_098780 [Parastagonospora nodorum]KAH4902180.1 hypothetical protein HBI80_134630 [Parastagonospora nodorum]KAH5169580.1 hypothetical protein HBI73_004220 [Parastagonospora nodorum]KAH5205961.1 hypothetical protein HBH68_089950 [Parastagonospora nodorum]KAH5236431.1 hypothetical protein HBI62_017290 [Parastagonospora nodorum]